MTDGYSFIFNEGVVTVSMEIRSTGVDEFEKELMAKFMKFCAEIFNEPTNQNELSITEATLGMGSGKTND